MFIWKTFCLLFLGAILFLVVRLLTIKNFSRSKAKLNKT
jgi:hypothetical protein